MKSNTTTYEQLGALLVFDKRFQGLPKGYQKEIVDYKHVSAEILKSLSVDGGTIRLISTGLFDGYTTETISREFINVGEIIAIPTGGAANIKYYNGSFVDSGNILATTKRTDVSLKYVYYFLVANNQTVNSFYRGVSIKHPYMPDICKMCVPLPPIQEQEQIVNELDSLNSILEKKTKQVEVYEQLILSFFFDYFGNPKTNDKQWETIKWGDAFDTILGKMLDKNKQNPDDLSFPYLANINVRWGSFDLKELRTMTFSSKEVQKFSLRNGDLLICEGGEAGRCAVWGNEPQQILFQKAVHRARLIRDGISPYFVQYYLMTLRSLGGLKDYISRATIEHLTGEKLKTLPLLVPPFEFQSKFESIVKSIFRQEELIQNSIKETNELLSSRLDYYYKG